MRFAFYLALAHIRHSKRYIILPLLAITIGVIGLLVALAVISGFDTELTRNIVGYNPHILLRGTLLPSELERIKSIKGINVVERMRLGEGILLFDGNYSVVQIQGIKANSELLNLENKMIDGTFSVSSTSNILIGSELSSDLGIRAGDSVTLVVPTISSTSLLFINPMNAVKRIPLKVKGVFRTGMYDYDSRWVVVNRELYIGSEDLYGITLKHPGKANGYKKKIEKMLPFLNVYTWLDLNISFMKAIKIDEIISLILIVFIMLISGFGISNSLLQMVFSRRRQIGVMMALGASRNKIRGIFLIEGSMVGIIGNILGLSIGIFITYILSIFPIRLPSDIFYVTTLPINLHYSHIFMTCGFSLLIALISSIFPARKAAAFDPIEVIRYE